MVCEAVQTGVWSCGLRSCGVPCILACWGTITGPSWHFFLAADLRIVANDTLFHTPIENPPKQLAQILTEPIAKDLTMHRSTLSALTLLNLGATHECRATADECRAAALNMCRRITSYPNIACRNTMNLLNVSPTGYVTRRELEMHPDIKEDPY